MKKKNFKQEDITFLISIFLKDLESLCFEVGEAESRIPKKMRKMTENFYGRLISYSKQFDKIQEKQASEINETLKVNFNCEKIKYNAYSKYLRDNIKHFYKFEKKDFHKITFLRIKKKKKKKTLSYDIFFCKHSGLRVILWQFQKEKPPLRKET